MRSLYWGPPQRALCARRVVSSTMRYRQRREISDREAISLKHTGTHRLLRLRSRPSAGWAHTERLEAFAPAFLVHVLAVDLRVLVCQAGQSAGTRPHASPIDLFGSKSSLCHLRLGPGVSHVGPTRSRTTGATRPTKAKFSTMIVSSRGDDIVSTSPFRCATAACRGRKFDRRMGSVVGRTPRNTHGL